MKSFPGISAGFSDDLIKINRTINNRRIGGTLIDKMLYNTFHFPIAIRFHFDNNNIMELGDRFVFGTFVEDIERTIDLVIKYEYVFVAVGALLDLVIDCFSKEFIFMYIIGTHFFYCNWKLIKYCYFILCFSFGMQNLFNLRVNILV